MSIIGINYTKYLLTQFNSLKNTFKNTTCDIEKIKKIYIYIDNSKIVNQIDINIDIILFVFITDNLNKYYVILLLLNGVFIYLN